MFPESFVERWINDLTQPGDTVLDPFSGRGTTAFQAILMGRRAVACDTNSVAVCLTRAKTNAPDYSELIERLEELEESFDGRRYSSSASALSEFFRLAYARRTLLQILHLRSSLRWQSSNTDCMIAALLLGSLHGEMDRSQAYLSNQMPRTISTKPDYSVRFWRERNLVAPERDVFRTLRKHAAFRYETPPAAGASQVYQLDMRDLPRVRRRDEGGFDQVRCVITSPPYLDVTNFEEDQWLRLWFLGGPPTPTRGRVSRDDRHYSENSYWLFIADMWRSLGSTLPSKANVVIRLGSTRVAPGQLIRSLLASSKFTNRRIQLVSSERSVIQRRQTDAFRPGSKGCKVEVDCHFRFED